MKRKIFFFLERLEISRNERIAVSLLMTLLVLLSGYYALSEPKLNYDEEYYAALEELFEERSRIRQQETEMIMARYNPDTVLQDEKPLIPEQQFTETVRDTIIEDTTESSRDGTSRPLININSASSDELQQLPGIGPAFAVRIIEWREENGNFTSKEQLLEIRGIGETRLERIIPLITL